jgi:hypothetical protein
MDRACSSRSYPTKRADGRLADRDEGPAASASDVEEGAAGAECGGDLRDRFEDVRDQVRAGDRLVEQVLASTCDRLERRVRYAAAGADGLRETREHLPKIERAHGEHFRA